MKKRSSILLFISLIAVCLCCTFVMITGAQTSAPEVSIPYCNLSFRDSVCIKYAVDSSASDVKLLIWTSAQAEYTIGTQDSEITEYYDDEIEGKTYKIFDYTKLSAKQMTDVIYARAYVKVGNNEYYSEINKYSVLQYAYNKLGKTGTATDDEELKDILTHMLEYGAAAQKYLEDYKVDRLATADWYQVKLTAGVLDDGLMHGLYLPGDKVTITAAATGADGAAFAYWSDSKGNKVGTTATYELTVGNSNEVYNPVYVKYSSGLEIEEDDRAGVAYVVDIGTCEDTNIVIPPMSDNGYPITEIDRYAFENVTTLVSISFPSTVTLIGRYAFDGCTALTDVYYDGTEEEWTNNVEIETGNEAIESATKHFYEPAAATFTVTFVDYDGTVLKIETVESGKSATPPADPTRAGYIFTGWDKSFTNVNENLTASAQYEKSYTEPTIVVSSAEASAGATNVEITVSLKNNPGVTSMLLQIAFDDDVLDLASMTYNTEIGGTGIPLQSTASPVKVYWAEGFTNVTGDWVLVTLNFNISNSATAGDYGITVTYNADDVFNADEVNVDFDIINGKITVS